MNERQHTKRKAIRAHADNTSQPQPSIVIAGRSSTNKYHHDCDDDGDNDVVFVSYNMNVI
jgi:hypothetical protein